MMSGTKSKAMEKLDVVELEKSVATVLSCDSIKIVLLSVGRV
jgi:hypothetical protein